MGNLLNTQPDSDALPESRNFSKHGNPDFFAGAQTRYDIIRRAGPRGLNAIWNYDRAAVPADEKTLKQESLTTAETAWQQASPFGNPPEMEPPVVETAPVERAEVAPAPAAAQSPEIVPVTESTPEEATFNSDDAQAAARLRIQQIHAGETGGFVQNHERVSVPVAPTPDDPRAARLAREQEEQDKLDNWFRGAGWKREDDTPGQEMMQDVAK